MMNFPSVHYEHKTNCKFLSNLSVAFAALWIQHNFVFSASDVEGSRALVIGDPLDALNRVLQEIWPYDLAVGARGEVSAVIREVVVAEECLRAINIAEKLSFAEASLKGVLDVHGGRGQGGHDLVGGAAEPVAAQPRALPVVGDALPAELVEVHLDDVVVVASDAPPAAHEQAVTDEGLAAVSPHGESAVRAPLS